MAATKSVKIVTDLLTNKQIIKQDINENILFRISGSLGDGFVSSSLPVTASYIRVTEKLYPGINILADVSASNATEGQYLKLSNGKWIASDITVEDIAVNTSGNIEGVGTTADPIRLKSDIQIVNLTASAIAIGGPIVNNPQSSAPFSQTTVNAGYSAVIDQFSSEYSAAKYIILCKTATNCQMSEIGTISKENKALIIPYAINYTSNQPMATFGIEKDVQNNVTKLLITNETANTFTVTLQRVYLI
jgi:hypothetical protein